MVAEMEPMAEVFMPISRVARELCWFLRPSGETERAFVGGRCETQSWTRRETEGFERRFRVLREEGLVVIIMVGAEDRGEDVLVKGWVGR